MGFKYRHTDRPSSVVAGIATIARDIKIVLHRAARATATMVRSLCLLVSILLGGSNAWISRGFAERGAILKLHAGRKFSQPAFSQSAHSRKPEKEPEKRKYGSDSRIGSMHQERIKTAGREGTKRFVNPCKVFLGNLPFNTTEDHLKDWVCEEMGLPATILLNECKVIRDWKTGDSKGYGFVVFTEPIYATVCIDKCNGKELWGRRLNVKQGQKKQDTTVYVKKKKEKAKDADEEAIQAGIDAAEDPMDAEQAALLRMLDPDLAPEFTDDELFGGDDDDDEVDGFWAGDEEEVEEFGANGTMNREKRREAARKQKRRKLPHTGFG